VVRGDGFRQSFGTEQMKLPANRVETCPDPADCSSFR